MVLALFLARFAVGNGIREALLPQVLKASLIVGELSVKILDCVP